MKKYIYAGVAVAILATSVLLISQQANESNQVASETTQNSFDPATLKVGDVVAGMTVAKIGPANKDVPINFKPMKDNRDTPLNYEIDFTGDKVLQGTYDAVGEMFYGRYLTLDQKSEASLPRPYNAIEIYGNSKVGAVSIPQDEKMASVTGDKGTLTVEISDFKFIGYQADYGGYYVTVKKVVESHKTE